MTLGRWLSKITMGESENWRRTDSKCADEDAKNVGITSLLDDRVPPHQEFIGLCRLKRCLARHGIVSMDLEVTEEIGHRISGVQMLRGESCIQGLLDAS